MGTTTNVIVVVLVLIGGYYFGVGLVLMDMFSGELDSVEEEEKNWYSCGENQQLIGNECFDRDNQVNNPPDEPVLELNVSFTELENEIEILINIEREKHGLQPLQSNALLREVSHSHSLDMARNNFFAHVNTRGQDATDRGITRGYNCEKQIGMLIHSGIAENLYMQPVMSQAEYNEIEDGIVIWVGFEPAEDFLLENLPSSVVRGWMDSPGHRANILTAEYIFGEIGIAHGPDGGRSSGMTSFYITHNFSFCNL